MKILHVVHGFLPQFQGGTELYLWRLINEQKSRGLEVTVLTGSIDHAESARIEPYEHEGVAVRKLVLSGAYLEHWTRSHSPDAAALYRETLREIRPDLVHIHHWYRLTRNLVEIAGDEHIPVVCTLHDLWTTCPRIFRIREESFCDRPLGRESCTSCVPRFPWMDDEWTAREIDLFQADFRQELSLADRVIVPSEAHGRLVRNMIQVKTDQLLTVPHGTIADLRRRLDIYDKDGRQPKGFERKIRLGCWGHLFHMKGAHLILEALKSIKERDRFETHIWGKVVEPHYKARLEKAAEGLDVHWHGAFTPRDVEEQSLDLAVLPSLCSESFSFVLDEAFRLGLPAVVSDRGALAERIGSAGVAFKAESADDLGRVLSRISRDRSVIDRWRAKIPQLETMKHHAERLIEIYQDVIEEHPRRIAEIDRSLSARRTRHLSYVAARQEQLMFGYLGHIKRESGRGDHYESVVKKMIEEQHEFGRRLNETQDSLKIKTETAQSQALLLEFLASEMQTFRDTINLIHRPEKPALDRKPTPAPDVAAHVPNLGAAQDIARTDHDMLKAFVDRLTELQAAARATELHQRLAERERRISELDAIIAALNARVSDRNVRIGELESALQRLRQQSDLAEQEHTRLTTQIEECRDEKSALTSRLEKIEIQKAAVEVELGQARAARVSLESRLQESEGLRADLEKNITELSERARVARRDAERRDRIIFVLSGMIDTLRKAIAKIHETEVFWREGESSLAKDLRDYDAPNLGKLSDALKFNHKMISEYIAAVRTLRSALDLCRQDLAKANEEKDAGVAEAARQSSETIRIEVERIKTSLAAAESELDDKRRQLEDQGSAVSWRDQMISHLAVLIEDMRRALTVVFLESPVFVPQSQDYRGLSNHVPGLGDLPTIEATNLDLITRHIEELKRLKHRG